MPRRSNNRRPRQRASAFHTRAALCAWRSQFHWGPRATWCDAWAPTEWRLFFAHSHSMFVIRACLSCGLSPGFFVGDTWTYEQKTTTKRKRGDFVCNGPYCEYYKVRSLKRSAIDAPGMVNNFRSLAHHFWINLLASFTQPEASTFADLFIVTIRGLTRFFSWFLSMILLAEA